MHITAVYNYATNYLSLFFQDPPGPIDNAKITVNKNGHLTLKQGIIIIIIIMILHYYFPAFIL